MTIRNASNTPLNQQYGGLPQLDGALMDWLQSMTAQVIVKSIVNFVNVETKTEVAFKAVRQPLTQQRLMMKPEGQRGWKWEMLHATPELQMVVDDRIVLRGTEYRVMARSDFQEYGYIMYEIAQDYA